MSACLPVDRHIKLITPHSRSADRVGSGDSGGGLVILMLASRAARSALLLSSSSSIHSVVRPFCLSQCGIKRYGTVELTSLPADRSLTASNHGHLL